MNSTTFIRPDWPVPAGVCALQTTRAGGVSGGPYASFNLGAHVGDEPAAVEENRRRLVRAGELPMMPRWLSQVHGRTVADLGTAAVDVAADAAVARERNQVCAVMTADCLPVLLCDEDASVVGAAHGGWRGLAAGVLEACVKAMDVPPERIMAWLGPAIGPDAFEVGDEVRSAFVDHDPRALPAFRPSIRSGKYLADLYALARLRLGSVGVKRTYGGDFCTWSDAGRFFSYRRDGTCGRMATLIWLQR